MRVLSREDLENYVIGAGILGCGGGGGASTEMIDDAFKRGLEFRLADISELPLNGHLCIVAGVGGGVSKEDRDRVAPYSQGVVRTREARTRNLQRVAKELADYIGIKEFNSYVAAETGPGNGLSPMYLNAVEGKPSVDGDACGRAKPEMGLSLTNVVGISIAPMTILTPFGEVVILKSVVDDTRAEDITRHVAVASGGSSTIARCPGTVQEYEKGIVPGQVARCINIGAAIRKARSREEKAVEAFQKETKAHRLFEGKVTSFEMEGKGGFNWGNWYIDGTGKYEGKKLRVWYKNEHLISWLDGVPNAMCPDLICVVDSKTSDGLSNFVQSGTHNGKDVTVFGIPAHERWRTPKGIEIFGPKHFGFDIQYKAFY